MNTRLYEGRVVRVVLPRKLVELALFNGERVMIHRDEMLPPNPFLGEMSWEDVIIEKARAKFWALDVPKYPAGIDAPYIDFNKTDYWSAQQDNPPAEISDTFSFAGESARSTYKSVKSKIMPQIEEVDRALLAAIGMGRYDIAYGIAKLVYSGLAHHITADQVQFKGQPGSTGLVLVLKHTHKKMARVVSVPGVAASVIYTWWALHGGWHNKGQLWEPFDLRNVLYSVSSPFLLAGCTAYTYDELKLLHAKSGAITVKPTGMRKEHIGPMNKYYVIDDVVYVKNGPSYVPMGLASKDLERLPGKRRSWDVEWVTEETKKLKLSNKQRNFFISKAKETNVRISTQS